MWFVKALVFTVGALIVHGKGNEGNPVAQEFGVFAGLSALMAVGLSKYNDFTYTPPVSNNLSGDSATQLTDEL